MDLQQPEKKEKSSVSTPFPLIAPSDLAGYIDHTLLKPPSTIAQFDQLCEEALIYRFKSVCVNSAWVSFVAEKLRGSGIKTCSVIGFPLGETDTLSKAYEAGTAISNGAEELDMVISVSAIKSKNFRYAEDDIKAVKKVCGKNIVLKVIIETFYLTEEEKKISCGLVRDAGADFVKTSTGFVEGGATIEDIRLMRNLVGPEFGVKASGGIRTYEQAVSMIRAGANRLGCGSGVAIIKGAESFENY